MNKSIYIHKSHNVSVLLYHLVCIAKYRQIVFTEAVDLILKEVCLEIAKRYEVIFLEIGIDRDHVHFLLQSIPTYSLTKNVCMIKSITAREVFLRAPEVRSDERRVGKECVSTCRYLWSTYHEKKKKHI